MAAKLADAVLFMHDRAKAVESAPWLSAIEQIISQNTEALLKYNALFPIQSVLELIVKVMLPLIDCSRCL